MLAFALAVAAAPIPQTPPPAPVAEPSAAQTLFSTVEALWRNLSRLEPGEVALNLFLSVLVIAITALVVWILRRLLHAAIGSLARHGPEAPAPAVAGPRGARLTWSLLKTVLALVAVVVLLSIWGVDLVGWLTTSGAGAVLLRLALVLLIATALIVVAGHLVNRLLMPLTRRLSAERRAAQVRTLGPLIRGTVQGFIVVLASLTILSELGVKIGPLLASAGVVGIAVGFGAQTLVKDFLTGLFLVIEDIVAVGDNIRVGDRAGTVEAMTLRTLRIRSADGVLHILPYSEAQVISNRTKSFSSYVFDIGIGYGSDIDHAFEVMRRVGADLQADPEFGARILQPLEVLGVDALGESAVMLKARFRTRPGDQWTVGREYNRRIKYAFDAEGIELPYAYRKLVFDGALPVQPAPPPNEPE
jgi:small conductance mechanosensitive channel